MRVGRIRLVSWIIAGFSLLVFLSVAFSLLYGFLTSKHVNYLATGSMASYLGIIILLLAMAIFSLLIAERRSAGLLVKSESRLRLLLDSTVEGIYGVDLDGRCIFCNPSCLKILGYKSESDLIGKNLHNLIHHSHPDGTPYPYENCILAASHRSDQEFHSDDVVFWRSDGTCFPAEYWAHHIVEAGEVVGHVVTLVDVTERKKTEREVLEGERFLKSIYLAADNVAFVVTDLNGKDSRILDFSPGAESIFGYDRKEVAGERVAILFNEKFSEDLSTMQAVIEKGGKGYNGEAEMLRKTGERFPALFNIQPRFGVSGEVAGAVIVAVDISERRLLEKRRLELEAQIQQEQKLESLGLLAGGIAHDFNNILMTIMGNAGMALKKLGSESPAKKSLEQIDIAAKRAADLAKQMLDYSGKGKFQIQTITINDQIREIGELLRSTMPKNVTLELDLEEDIPYIDADPVQVRQIIMNLVINGSEAIGEAPGVVTVQTGSLLCDFRCRHENFVGGVLPYGRYALLKVSDTGMGMEEKTKGRMFDPFFTTKAEGRGLGMAVILGIVKGHHGGIRVTSKPGHGTTVEIGFPVRKKKSLSQGKAAAVQENSLTNGTVLVVDDEEMERTVASEILVTSGFNVLAASDGKEGVKTFRHQADKIDLVLMDLSMPVMGGMDAMREIREINPDVLIILSSGYSEGRVAEQVKVLPGVAFIQKPYTPNALLDVVGNILKTVNE